MPNPIGLDLPAPLPVIAVTQWAGEQDILDIRRATLRSTTIHHVIVCATHTFQGDLVPWSAPVIDGPTDVTTVRYDNPLIDGLPDPWSREPLVRDAALDTAELLARHEGWHPDRVWLLISDLDEIPHPDAVAQVQREGRPGMTYSLPVRYHQLAIDLAVPWPAPRRLWEWAQPLMVTLGAVLRAGRSIHGVRREWQTRAGGMSQVGWHLSCMGGPDTVAAKLRAYSHTELSHLTADDIRECLRGRQDIAGRTHLVDVHPLQLPPPVYEDWHTGGGRWGHLFRRALLDTRTSD